MTVKVLWLWEEMMSMHTTCGKKSTPRETKACTCPKTQSKTTLRTMIDATVSPNHTLTNTTNHTSQRQQLSGITWMISSSIKSRLTVLNRLWQKPGANSACKLRTPYRRTYPSKWMISDVSIQIQIMRCNSKTGQKFSRWFAFPKIILLTLDVLYHTMPHMPCRF